MDVNSGQREKLSFPRISTEDGSLIDAIRIPAKHFSGILVNRDSASNPTSSSFMLCEKVSFPSFSTDLGMTIDLSKEREKHERPIVFKHELRSNIN
jgi:hypothetical protein